ncbi:MAG: GDP-fucose synthetase [Terriglobia bacterium]|nr:MAG: GDP-fucose synthetase [Terriglobia bacterium]
MDRNASVYVAGHRGLAGSAIVRALRRMGHERLILRTHDELDLRNQQETERLFRQERPQYVFLAAARVGGILANSTYPADFIRDNLQIHTNIIDCAHRYGARKLLYLGSSCIYPKFAPQPIKEESFLTGPLEPTNDAYAIAKIAGIRMLQAYRQQYGFCGIALMPTNLYGPGDSFHPTNSHVLPALMRRFHEAKSNGTATVSVWGTGGVRREFLYVDDLAEAALLLMEKYDSPEIINVGTGEDITIRELAELVSRTVGYTGRIVFDTSKPDGTPRKLLDVTRIRALGFRPKVPLEQGLQLAYRSYRETYGAVTTFADGNARSLDACP